MSSENFIHIKLEYEEALRTKRSILSSELNSMNISKIILRYRDLRMKELALKSRAYWKIKETRSQIRKLQNFLPGVKIPSLLKKEKKMEKRKEASEKKVLASYGEGSIDSQIREIQRRLDELQSGNI